MKQLANLSHLTIAVMILALSGLSFAQGAGVLNSKALKMPAPVVPAAARALKASGSVNVQITVDETGNVVSAKAVSGHPLLRGSAENAAMQAQFKPFMRGGRAIRTTGVLSYNFASTEKAHNAPEKTISARTEARNSNGNPTAAEVKAMLEEKFTSIYEDHYWGEKNVVEFEWLAPVQMGGQTRFNSIPVACWAATVDVKVTFTKRSSGETGSVRRGINGHPVKEGFCIYRDAYDKWTYMTYAP
jgi:TonB family protein